MAAEQTAGAGPDGVLVAAVFIEIGLLILSGNLCHYISL
jgi:hypothetical protein